jgi:BASS family bile acid:Na+ symporter
VALAIVGAMPIAGSSTTWAQNAEGNVALSLCLVLMSTVLSPLLIPLFLRAAAGLTSGTYGHDLDLLADGGGGGFVALSVVVPSLLGMGLRQLGGPARVAQWLPWIKALTLVDLFHTVFGETLTTEMRARGTGPP